MAKTVLCVDDDPEIRDFVKVALESKAYQVLLAGSVAEGARLAVTRFPDLVITDVMMPGESGYVLCARLKNDPSTADIPILVQTILEDEQRALEAGASAFLAKPLELEALIKTVEMVLEPTDMREVFNRGLANYRARNVSAAKRDLLEVARADPRGSLAKWARYYAGRIELAEGNTDAALRHFEDILDVDPAFWRAHNWLGFVYEHHGDSRMAIRHYQRSLSLNTNQLDLARKVESLAR